MKNKLLLIGFFLLMVPVAYSQTSDQIFPVVGAMGKSSVSSDTRDGVTSLRITEGSAALLLDILKKSSGVISRPATSNTFTPADGRGPIGPERTITKKVFTKGNILCEVVTTEFTNNELPKKTEKTCSLYYDKNLNALDL